MQPSSKGLRAAIPAPVPPFDRWVTHAFDPSAGHCWYDRARALLVTQTVVPQATVPGARVVMDWVDAALEHEAPAIRAAGGLMVFHDWRSLGGYDSDARVLVNDRMRRRPRGYSRRTICVVAPTPLWRMALTVTDLTYAMLGVPPAAMTGDMKRACEELGGYVPREGPAWLVNLRYGPP
jgi:hypothetical protein